jgi:Macrocin-O-methyltransferase (TylF)
MRNSDRLRAARELKESLKVYPEAPGERPRIASVRGAVSEVNIQGDYAQFGVFRGKTARYIESLMTGDRKLHLFDSFEGLPEDWTKNKKAGFFALSPDEIPTFDPERVVVHKGWFKDTVPVWAEESSASIAFIHIDADLYSSTIDVLFNLDKRIVAGTVILFDEYVMGQSDDEHRALLDWAAKFNRKFDYLWQSSGPQVCIRVTE